MSRFACPAWAIAPVNAPMISAVLAFADIHRDLGAGLLDRDHAVEVGDVGPVDAREGGRCLPEDPTAGQLERERGLHRVVHLGPAQEPGPACQAIQQVRVHLSQQACPQAIAAIGPSALLDLSADSPQARALSEVGHSLSQRLGHLGEA